MNIEFESELWEGQGQGAWFFVSLPKEYYDEIKLISTTPRKGFGSVNIEAAIGRTDWKTSIFPDTKSKSYLLPIKKEVRRNENLSAEDIVSVKIRIIEI